MKVERWVATMLVVFGVIVLGFGASVWLSALANDDPLYLEPQGSVRAQLAQAWIDDGAPRIDLAGRDEIPEDVQIALLPRDASIVDWQIVPKDFAYPVMLNTLVTPFGTLSLALITPLAALLAAGIVGRILYTLTASPLTSASGFVVAVTSIVWWSASYGGVSYALLGVSFGLLAVWLLIVENQESRGSPLSGRLLLAGISIGVASGFHYTSAPWWGAVFFVGCVGNWGWSKAVFGRLVLGGSGVLFGLAPVLVFNTFVYGGPTSTGYSEFATVFEAIGWSAPALRFSSAAFASNLRTYMIRPEIVPIFMLAALALPTLRERGIRVHAVHLGALAAGYGILVLVTGSATLWGTNTFKTNASFLRYSAPVFALLVVLAMLTIQRFAERDQRLSLAPAVFALAFATINIMTITTGAEGWSDSRSLIDQSSNDRESIRAAVPLDSVVITRRGDKVLFGERTTLIAAYLRTFTDEEGTSAHLYDTFPDIERLADVIIRLQPLDVILLNDSGWVTPIQIENLERLLSNADLCLEDTERLVMPVRRCPSDLDEQTSG